MARRASSWPSFSTAALFAPTLLLAMRWRLHALVPAALAFIPSAALQAMVAYRDIWLIPVAGVGAALVGAVWLALRPAPGRTARLLGAVALCPVVFWGPYFAGVALRDGALSFSPEIWGGILVWTGIEMLALGALALRVAPGREL